MSFVSLNTTTAATIISSSVTTSATSLPSDTVTEEQPVLMETSKKPANENETNVVLVKKKSKNKFLTGNEAY